MATELHKLDPEQELAYLKELVGGDEPLRLLDRVTESFNVLQARSAMLLSLVALCLTISGFSGPKIAESSVAARWGLAVGITSVILSAFCLMLGPLRLRWVTRWRADSCDASLIALLRQRNLRTCRYHLAVILLVAGLSAYVLALVLYLVTI